MYIWWNHYNDVIMDTMASQMTSLTIVYSTVYSGADQRKHQSSVSLAFVSGIHRGPVNSPHKWPVTRKMFPFDDVIMYCHPHLLWVGGLFLGYGHLYPDSKVHGANMGPTWGRQDPGRPHVGPMNFAIWVAMRMGPLILLIGATSGDWIVPSLDFVGGNITRNYYPYL